MSPPLPAARWRRAASLVAALALTLAAALALAQPARAATQVLPDNGSFTVDASGWNSTVATCTAVLGCATTNQHNPGEGNPPGSIEALFTVGVGVAANGTSVWATDSFTYTGDPPTGLAFRVDTQAAIGPFLTLGGSASSSAVLVNETSGTETVLVDVPQPTATDFVPRTAPALDPGILVPGETYRIELRTQFTAVATLSGASAAVRYDNVQLTVQTPGLEPDAVTLPATSPAPGMLNLRASVNPNGSPTAFFFQHGPDLELGQETTPGNLGPLTEPQEVTQQIDAPPGTIVFYRVVATNGVGTTVGQIEAAFVQATPGQPLAPAAVTLPAETPAPGTIVLRGGVIPNNAATAAAFDYGSSPTDLGNSTPPEDVGAGAAPVPLRHTIEVPEGSLIFYRVRAVNAEGTGLGLTLAVQATVRGPEPVGAGGLGACTPDQTTVAPPEPSVGDPGGVTLGREQLLINQRISQAAVRRVNAAIDRLRAGLTASDFRDCTIAPNRFSPVLLQNLAAGAPAAPAGRVAQPRPTPTRPTATSDPRRVTLSARQLLINQRISQAAVRRVNALRARLSDLDSGDIQLGTLTAAKLDTAARFAFVNGLPAEGQVSTRFRPLAVRARSGGNPERVTLSRAQLLINQRISQTAVRRINHIVAELRLGLTGDSIREGALSRRALQPALQAPASQ